MSSSPRAFVLWCVLGIGIVASACSFVFIRESVEPPVMLAAWRVLLAALILSPFYIMARSQFGDDSIGQILRRSMFPGIVLSAHFITWVIGARLSFGANATIIVNLVPLVMPLLMLAMYGEVLHRLEIIATGLALSGLLVLGMGDLEFGTRHLIGDTVCVVSMVLFALYLALARRQATLPSLWLYLVPMYAVAGIVSLLAAPWFGPVIPTFEWFNLSMVLALAAVSTVVGHSALNYAMQHMRGQTVSVMNQGQVVVAGVLGYLYYNEIPAVLFYPASALMVAGMLLVVFHQRVDRTS